MRWARRVVARVWHREPSPEVREARRIRAELERLACDARAESDAIMEIISSGEHRYG